MIYTDFHGEKLSLLGFGTMRLPLVPGGTPADIDEKTTADMVRYAMEHGVNYFDTAYPYHGGMSERVMGRVLKDYDRGSFYLATKYPGHQLSSHYDPAAIFAEGLRPRQLLSGHQIPRSPAQQSLRSRCHFRGAAGKVRRGLL